VAETVRVKPTTRRTFLQKSAGHAAPDIKAVDSTVEIVSEEAVAQEGVGEGLQGWGDCTDTSFLRGYYPVCMVSASP